MAEQAMPAALALKAVSKSVSAGSFGDLDLDVSKVAALSRSSHHEKC